MSATRKRPAHRPSRRGVIVETAFELFAADSVDEVTVADIAAAAEMTSAAIYYHYPSREEILLEGLREFSTAFVDEVARLCSEVVVPEGRVGALIAPLVKWLDANRVAANVYFVGSRGITQSAESLRRANTLELLPILASAARKARGTVSAAEASVIAVALVSEIDTLASAMLAGDRAYTSLGRRKFVDASIAVADRIADTGRQV